MLSQGWQLLVYLIEKTTFLEMRGNCSNGWHLLEFGLVVSYKKHALLNSDHFKDFSHNIRVFPGKTNKKTSLFWYTGYVHSSSCVWVPRSSVALYSSRRCLQKEKPFLYYYWYLLRICDLRNEVEWGCYTTGTSLERDTEGKTFHCCTSGTHSFLSESHPVPTLRSLLISVKR